MCFAVAGSLIIHRSATRRELENSKPKMTNYSSDLSSFMPDNEFVELLWENGQIVVQGQSNITKKSSLAGNVPGHSGKAQDKDGSLKRFSAMDQMVNELSPTVPSVIGSSTREDDNTPPWMNYSIEDPLQSDYCSEFLSEFSGVDLNSMATNTNGTTTVTDRITGFGFGRDSPNIQLSNGSRGITGGSEPSRIRKSQLFHLPQQSQSAIPISKPKTAAEFSSHGSTSTHQGSSGGDLLNTRSLRQDTENTKLPQMSGSLMNFSHFSRPVAMFKANLQGSDRLRSNEKTSTAGSSKPFESIVINASDGLKSIGGAIHGKTVSVSQDVVLRSSTKTTQDMASIQQSEAHKNHNKTIVSRPSDLSKGQNPAFVSSTPLGRQETEKAPEATVASSVCSGNSVGAASNDPKDGAKRKIREGEESGYQSDDVEDDSVGLKKPAPARGTSAKRSRASEVHNLSERRRRDRINERMRALQELIPNCNKVDKASMLDEAIEYLKTLQLQVQIMSMGTGLCMPPMMMPPAMQHIRASPMAHFSPMSVGMGMGMGYGMGMLDMNGSPGCPPLFPAPPFHSQQFPGAPGLQGMPVSTSLPVFGIPGQGLPISMPQMPQYNSFSTLPIKPNTMAETSGAAPCPASVPAVDTTLASSSKDQPHLSMNSEAPHQTRTDDSPIRTSSMQAPKEQPAALQVSDHALHISRDGAINSIRQNGSVAP
ncbi:hypothetical protein J5N97_014218 [Dioscorea zingiberensis]|uniref:BHLH domain-containing protein n=1 Tax=Dioscorea zingiberensis TaxID=325984 RepID=A0A9D5CTJ8_9LILI|nr:hypothetical protein J5N97_014218 [Dioscorea zingiberensis]